MKKRILIAFIAFSVLSVLLIACHKSTDEPEEWIVPFPLNPVWNCPYSPFYGDTLICTPNGNAPDYIISPVNNPGAGTYFSWPIGMKIDHYTGAINVSQSEAGMRYLIGFVKQGTTDTCLTPLIISGMSYMDSVFVLSSGQTTSVPYFNADATVVSACISGNCEFDMNGQAAKDKVFVNTTTGIIDLQKTLDQGAFGPTAVNGDMVETTIRYRINDGCTNKVQKLMVQLMYFDSKSQIDVGLINTILMKQSNIRNGNIINTGINPRPPLIIITRYN